MNIHGNKYINKAAKKGTELQKISLKKYVSLAFIKRKIKESSLNKWQIEYEKSKKVDIIINLKVFLNGSLSKNVKKINVVNLYVIKTRS